MPDHTNDFEDFDLEAIPVRTDITVLPADPPRTPLGFRVYERAGSPLRFVDEEEKYLREIGDLQPGMRVLAWESVATIERIETIESGEVPRAYGHLNGNLVFFEYETIAPEESKDFPEWMFSCWVAIGMANLRGVERLAVTRGGTDEPETSPEAPEPEP